MVDAFTCIEETRLDYIRTHQKDIRKYTLRGLLDAVEIGETVPASLGLRIILPPSYPNCWRFLFQNYQDALAICRWAAPPDLFITFTCNAKWAEIEEFIAVTPGQRPQDRPDIVARVFKIKLDEFITDLTKKAFFGTVRAVVYTVEFQKRGSNINPLTFEPFKNAVVYTVEFQKRGILHAHICLFLQPSDKYREPEDIDKIISAEIPVKEKDPHGYEAVTQFMIHGPCGIMNPDSPCMLDGKCSKYYPRDFCGQTTVTEDGYPVYRRRNDGRTFEKGEHTIDNKFVVPHNVDLLIKYQAHINVEWCNKHRSIKYLFKYMSKDPDMAVACIQQMKGKGKNDTEAQPVDEIQNYLNCRYVSASEACWRIFAFRIQFKRPPVQRLCYHLEQEQDVLFGDDEPPEEVLERVGQAKTTLTEWMTTNKRRKSARKLTYADFPTEWLWNVKNKFWKKRKNKGDKIGRIYSATPNSGEPYYLRLLLNIVKGATTFADIRTVNGVVHPTYRSACSALGLLDGDDEWHLVLNQAASAGVTAQQLRELFVFNLFGVYIFLLRIIGSVLSPSNHTQQK